MLPLKISMATLFKQTFANEMVMWFSTAKAGLKTICNKLPAKAQYLPN